VAVSRLKASSSSRVSRAASVSWPAGVEPRRGMALALRLRRRTASNLGSFAACSGGLFHRLHPWLGMRHRSWSAEQRPWAPTLRCGFWTSRSSWRAVPGGPTVGNPGSMTGRGLPRKRPLGPKTGSGLARQTRDWSGAYPRGKRASDSLTPSGAHSGTKARVWARRRPDPTVGAGATASLDCRVSHVRACAPVRLEIVNWGACLKIFG
jgi:hypothetical protein